MKCLNAYAKRSLSLILALSIIFAILPPAGAAAWTAATNLGNYLGVGDKIVVQAQITENKTTVTNGVSVVSCTSDDTDVVKVGGNSTDGFTVTALAEGKADFSVTVSYNGEEQTIAPSIEVAVPDVAIPHVLEMSENFTGGNLIDTAQNINQIDYSVNGWLLNEDEKVTTERTFLTSNASWLKFNDSSKDDLEDSVHFRLNAGKQIGFEFYVPVAGKYNLEVTELGYVTAERNKLNISVLKKTETSHEQVGDTWAYTMAGQVAADAHGDGSSKAVVAYMPNALTLEKGWHTVVFNNASAGANSFRFKRIALIPDAESTTIELADNIDYAIPAMLLKNQASINTHGWAVDVANTTNHASDAYLRANNIRLWKDQKATYKFYLPGGKYAVQAVASVMAGHTGEMYIDGNDTDTKEIPETEGNINLGIAEYSAGYHTITIRKTNDGGGNFYPKSFTFTKVKEGDIGYTLSASLSEKLRYTGDTADLSVKATGTGVNLDESKLDIDYIVEPVGVVEVSDAGVVTAVGAGTAKITVSTLYEGNKTPVTYELEEITVAARPTEQQIFTINFYKGLESQTALYNLATIDANNYEVCPAPETTARILGQPTHFRAYTEYASMRMTSDNEQVTIKTYVPVAGEYKVNLKSGTKSSSGGDWMISVDGTEVGDYTFKTGADGLTSGENVYVGTVNFATPGYKKITFKWINYKWDYNANNAYVPVGENFYPAELSFVPNTGESDAEISAELLSPVGYVGHKSDLFVKVTDGDVTIPLSKIKNLTYTADASIVKFSQDYSSVTAVGKGETSITVSGEYAGKNLSCSVPVSVTEMPTIGQDIIVNFKDHEDLYNGALQSSVAATIEKHGWEVDSSNINKRWYYKEDHLQMRIDVTNADPGRRDDINNYHAAFRVYVPITGYYRFDFNSYKQVEGGAALDFFVNDNYVGEYSFNSYPEASGKSEEVHMNTLWLEAGDTIIKAKWTDAGDGGNVWLSGFALTALEEMPTLESVDCTIKKKALYPGEETDFSAQAIMNTGDAYFFSSKVPENTITYSTVTVDESGNVLDVSPEEQVLSVTQDGRVCALNPGKGRIVATAVVDGKTESEYVEVEVTEHELYSVTAAFSSNKIFPDDTADISFVAKIGIFKDEKWTDSKNASLDFVDIQVVVPESSKDKISVSKDEEGNWTLTALADGDAQIEVTATLAGKSVSIVPTVTVHKRVLELHHVELSADKTQIKVGETLQITAQGIQYNGEPSDLSELEVFYDTQDASIAVVDENGVVSGVNEGETDVVVHIRKDDFIRSATLGVKVEGYAAIESAAIKMPGRIYVGTVTQAETTAVLKGSGAKITVPASAVTYSLAEPTDCVTVTSDGAVTAVATGTAKLQATVTLGDAPVETDVFEVVISESQASNTIIFDFSKYYPTAEPNKTPLDVEYEREGWEVNQKKTSSKMIELNGNTNERFAFKHLVFNAMAEVLDTPTVYSNGKTNNSSDLSLDLNIPESGTYKLTIGGVRYNSGCLVSVYIDGEYIGNYDFDMENRGGTDFNCIFMQAGRHNITLRAITGSRSSNKYHYMLFGSIIFNRISMAEEAFAELTATPESSCLVVGETVNVDVKTKMVDGKEFMFDPSDKWPSQSSITVTSDSAAVEVNEDGRTITAKAIGSANITVTAVIEGVTKTISFPVTVDGEILKTVDAELREPLVVGGTSKLVLTAKTGEGEAARTINSSSLKIVELSSSDEAVVKVDKDTLTVYGLRSGQEIITGSAEINGNTAPIELVVSVTQPILGKLQLKADSYVMRPTNTEGIQLSAMGYDAAGNMLDMSGAGVVYTSLTPDILTVSEGGLVKPVGQTGTGKIHAQIGIDGSVIEAEVIISVRDGKVGSTYYTPAKVEAARENIQKYSWANSTKEAAIVKADKYLELTDFIWENITTDELPRNTQLGNSYDPGCYLCKYCGANMYDSQYSTNGYGWLIDPINDPWKIKCPACRRRFPSNDFWSFYQLGIKDGVWSYERSLKENARIVDAGGEGYLVNKLYPEKDIELGVEGWGVDDGFGYKTGNYFNTTARGMVEEAHTYIAYYNRQGIYMSQESKPALFGDSIIALRDAYLYTGDAKYGRVGAIILDRFADVYPDMDSREDLLRYGLGDPQARGKITNRIPEPQYMEQIIRAYDALFDMYDDPYVVGYLSRRAAENNMANDKTTPEKIRQNLEDGILRAVHDGCVSGQLNSNFGLNSAVMSTAALVLDNHPETLDWIEWLNKPEETWAYPVNGGSIMPQLVDIVDRDGFGDEGAITYNMGWGRALKTTAEMLKLYNEAYPNADVFNLYEEPKYKKALLAELPILLSRNTTPQVGDGGRTAEVLENMSIDVDIDYFQNTGDIEMAQAIYLQEKNNIDNLTYDIFTKNPESLAQEIKDIIAEHGEYDVNKSRSLQGFGFSILKDGATYKSQEAGTKSNTQRNFWISWLQGYGHRHPDKLNLGIEAWGLNLAPDMGYTRNSWGDEYTYWGHSTISHNTVVVNEQSQPSMSSTGELLHFDDGGDIQLMDIDGSNGYPTTDIYRRSLVMINVDDTISYGVDFFHVRGGYDHLYSFHALSDNVTLSVDTVKQTMGTYAGPDVPFGTSPTTTAYSWFDNVRRAKNPQTGEFSADFKIRDFRNTLGKGQQTNLHLRMTMLNDYDLDEITATAGYPSQYRGNPETMEWVFARRIGQKGDNLDTLFTTVFEPYEEGSEYITDLEQVPVVEIKGGGRPEHGRDDQVKAIKVTLKDRVDYIVYATNTDILYRVGDKFDFQGFMGVYTIDDNGEILRTYAHDATLLEEKETPEEERIQHKNVVGTVKDFTREASFENYITLTSRDEVAAQDLVGKYVFVENDGTNCAAYEILGASKNGSDITLDIGDITLIRRYVDSENAAAGFEYDIAVGDTAEIRNRVEYNSAPVFNNISNHNVAANSRASINMAATSPAEKKITYSAVALPRGASVDSNTGIITWTPDGNQVGEHHFAIQAFDGSLSRVANFQVTVYKSVSGAISAPSDDTPAPQPGGSGGGGGGGETPSGGNDTETGDSTGETTGGETVGGETGGDTTGERFVDLGGHTWAKEAIYCLVDLGVINGTSLNTYSPAKDIKRADFAIMLARAFNLPKSEGENFADVDASKYYAQELLDAKAAGMINGVGNNNFNPEGEITRQDMMLMLYRALLAQGYTLSEPDHTALAGFADAAQVSDYAKDAVSVLVKDGYITGSNGKINPLARATRAEIAVMLSRVLAEEK